MRADPGSFEGRSILISGSMHHNWLTPCFGALLRPGDCLLDIGANIGFFTLLGAKLVGSTGCVHAVEAAPEIAALLRANLELNPFHNVFVHELAVSDRRGTLEFHTATRNHSGISSIRDLGPRTATTTRLPCNTIDSLLDEIPSVTLAKLDVEGAEMLALRGMGRLLQRDQPYLIVELSDSYLRDLGSSAGELCHFLATADYSLYRIDWDGVRALNEPTGEQCDLLCVPRQKTLPQNLIPLD
jgi:FkbM family methyltransferase